MGKVSCPYCKKVLKSKGGFIQHVKASPYCISVKAEMEAAANAGGLEAPATMDTTGFESANTQEVSNVRLLQLESESDVSSEDEFFARTGKHSRCDPPIVVQVPEIAVSERWTIAETIAAMEEDDDEPCPVLVHRDSESEDDGFDPFAVVSSSEEEMDDDEEGKSSEAGREKNKVEEGEKKWPPNERTNRKWEKYVKHAFTHFMPLEDREKSAVRIMHTLVKKRATLDTYEAVFEWHLRESGKLQDHEDVGKSKYYVSREKMMAKLKLRYHMTHQYATPHRLVLPHSKTKLEVWKKRAQDNVLSLLTDPRWQDKDWLYFDEDPFAPPPEDLSYIEDINTGQAYRETYKKLITKPNQILVAVPLYIDGAVTGQYDKLQVTALKMTLGILNRRARDKEYAWKSLGYVTNYTKEDSRGKKIFVESGHIAAFEQYVTDDEGEDGHSVVDPDVDMDIDKAADYHAILDVLLESLDQLMKDGMVVDIYYKGKRYANTEVVFFSPFIKCDGDEGDKLCCLYRSRSKGQQSLCRYCMCPNGDTDNQEAKYPYKS